MEDEDLNPQWEYKTTGINNFTDIEQLQTSIDLGKQGWEAFATGHDSFGTQVLLKRKLPKKPREPQERDWRY